MISAYQPEKLRAGNLSLEIKKSRDTFLATGADATWTEESADVVAADLLERDQQDDNNPKFGQSVRKTFPLADFFVDLECNIKDQLERLIHLVFYHPHMSPTREEYGMFMAQAAALRSADTSRQVGAVIVDEDGELVATGCNEVPKPGGGIYWSGDDPDHRDFRGGTDPNALMGREVLHEVFKNLKAAGWLSDERAKRPPEGLVEDARSIELFEHARVGNLIEFGRVVHAEMNALLHAARQGVRIRGRALYCTTFPCHGCARHLIGAGIARVVYVEPYPKSLALDLYPNAIEIGASGSTKLSFVPFTGVAPRRYLEFFGYGRRKDDHGYATNWDPDKARPRMRPLGSPWLLPEHELSVNLLRVLEDRAWI